LSYTIQFNLQNEFSDQGIYNTDVIDTDYSNWLLLLHCSDPEPNKKFLSSFVLSRTPNLDKMTTDYLKEKVGFYDVDLSYLFFVNQTNCFGVGPLDLAPVAYQGD
jgi:hypothetical protein